MAIQDIYIINVIPYRDDEGNIHSADIIFSIKKPIIDKIMFVGFTYDILLVKKAIKSMGSSIDVDISIGVYSNFEKSEYKEKEVRIIKTIISNNKKGVPDRPVLNIKGEIIKLIKRSLSLHDNYLTEYYVGIVDCGFRIEFIIQKSKTKCRTLQIGDYVIVSNVNRIDIELPKNKMTSDVDDMDISFLKLL